MDTRKPISPSNVIDDLYSNELNSLLDELFKKITLKEYDHEISSAYIVITVKNNNYNNVVLNEVKRRYLKEGWGNIFYKPLGDVITFQLYFPQIKSVI